MSSASYLKVSNFVGSTKVHNFQESAEVKRKNSKRTFKTEKEFLEFTLKYHQVLTERDAGKYRCEL